MKIKKFSTVYTIPTVCMTYGILICYLNFKGGTMANLLNLAKDRVKAENKLEDYGLRRERLLAKILEAEDEGKGVDGLKKDLMALDGEVDILKARLTSIKTKMDKAAEKNIRDRLKNIPNDVKEVNTEALQVEHQLAEHLAGAEACASALGMGSLLRRISSLIKSDRNGFEGTAEEIRLASFKDQSRIPELPNIREKRSRINELKTIKATPLILANKVDRMVKSAIREARGG
jgi:hypothetical protein